VKKIVILDQINNHLEPYDRQYILGEVAGYCHRNPSILRNASMTSVWGEDHKDGMWETHEKVIHCVSFEIDELTEGKWEFLCSSIGSWAVELKVLPDDWETTVIFPSEFEKV